MSTSFLRFAGKLCVLLFSAAAVCAEDTAATSNIGDFIEGAREMASDPQRPPPVRRKPPTVATTFELHKNSADVQDMFNKAYRADHPARTAAAQRDKRRDERDARKLEALQRRLAARGK